MQDTILKPLMTEKIVAGEQQGKYTFWVKNAANKISVRQAVEKVYGVKVINVNIIPVHPQKVTRRYGEGKKGIKAKKAIITLRKGETLKKK